MEIGWQTSRDIWWTQEGNYKLTHTCTSEKK